ncbi:MAG: zinc ribbon domain-containing protein [Clostridiales bacterium]|nr:zinc ribbon domain-containing protein [Clostridiales bacterium]
MKAAKTVMTCWRCGKKLPEDSLACPRCGAWTASGHRRPKYFKASFVLGILSLCLPSIGMIFGAVGLPLAHRAKRRSAVVMNAIGIALWIGLFVLVLVAAAVHEE